MPPPSAPQTAAAPVSPAEITKAPGDLRAIIANQLAAGTKTVTVPPGVYRVSPENKEHLRFEGLKDVTIVADGVEMLCTETTRAITIANCENLTIKGLTIDYDPLPFTQGRIVEISPDFKKLTVEILEGYQEPGNIEGSVEIFDPETRELRARITHYQATSEMTGPKRAVITKNRTGGEFAFEKPGDIAVIKVSNAPGGTMPHAIMATESTNLVFEDVTLYAGNVFGFLENGCDGSRYLRCKIDRRPPESDPVPRAIPRLRSLNADAFHSKNARRGPHYEECTAFFMGDDAIAVNGDFHFVASAEGTVLRVLAKHTMTMREGDEVQLFTKDGSRPPNHRIVSITPDGRITPGERDYLITQNLNDNLRRNALEQAFRIELDEAPEGIGQGTLICDANGIGNGLVVRNCHVGHNRSRGILVKAGRGEITGNRITGSRMTAILVSPEYWWLEAGLADDLVISDNVIRDGWGMGIAVVATGSDSSVAPAGAFNNITIRNNTIEGGALPSLLLTSVRGGSEENNTIAPDPSKSLHPWELGSWSRGGLNPVMRINTEMETKEP